MLTTSDVLGGRYRLSEPIATGGMGEVWQATDTVLGRTVAVKVLRADLTADASFGARFRAEARTLATVHHPGIVEVYDYGEVDGSGDAYLVMAYVPGEPLSHRIAAAGGRLSPGETMSVVAQTGRALSAAHAAGVVHRDVKPDNLLIQADGHVVLVDFGVAYTPATVGLTGAREVIGTARYMAPEQVTKQPTSPATDVYALGVVAYQCLAGEPPFDGESAVAVAIAHLREEARPLPADVPPAVAAVVARALAKDPADRFPSAAAMTDAAEAAVAGGARSGSTLSLPAVAPIGSAPVPPSSYTEGFEPYVPPPPSRAGRRLAIAGALLAVAIGVGAVLLALDNGSGGAPGGPVVGPSTSASHPRGPASSASRGHATKTPSTPASSAATSPSPSPTPTATTTPTTSPSPTATETTGGNGGSSGPGGGGGGGPGPGGGGGPSGSG